MAVAVFVVCTSFGFEAGHFVNHNEPQPSQHVIEHVIRLVSQPARSDLQRHVSIPEVVTRSRESERVLRSHAGHTFGCRPHAYMEAIRRTETIALDERATAGKQDRRLAAAIETNTLATLLPLVIGQRQGVAFFFFGLCVLHELDQLDHCGHPPQNKK